MGTLGHSTGIAVGAAVYLIVFFKIGHFPLAVTPRVKLWKKVNKIRYGIIFSCNAF